MASLNDALVLISQNDKAGGIEIVEQIAATAGIKVLWMDLFDMTGLSVGTIAEAACDGRAMGTTPDSGSSGC